MGKARSSTAEATGPPGGLSANFCGLFKGVCADCPHDRNSARRSRRARSGPFTLPPYAEAAIAELARCRRLTRREREVLTHCCAGAKNADIARALRISSSAIRRHLRNLHKKTNTVDKAELILNLWHSCLMPPESGGPPSKRASASSREPRASRTPRAAK